MNIYELSLEISDAGGWEEFHQKQGNIALYEFYKKRRLALISEYNNQKG